MNFNHEITSQHCIDESDKGPPTSKLPSYKATKGLCLL